MIVDEYLRSLGYNFRTAGTKIIFPLVGLTIDVADNGVRLVIQNNRIDIVLAAINTILEELHEGEIFLQKYVIEKDHTGKMFCELASEAVYYEDETIFRLPPQVRPTAAPARNVCEFEDLLEVL